VPSRLSVCGHDAVWTISGVVDSDHSAVVVLYVLIRLLQVAELTLTGRPRNFYSFAGHRGGNVMPHIFLLASTITYVVFMFDA